MRNPVFVPLFLLSLCGNHVEAALYKWTDENGKIHFSDTAPHTVQDKNKLEIIKDEGTEAPLQPAAPVARDPSTPTRPLVLGELELWPTPENRKQHVGLYYFGSGCGSPTAMLLPDAQSRHPTLFPSSAFFQHTLSAAIRRLGYTAHLVRSDKQFARLVQSDGLKLSAKLSHLNFNTCANKSSRSFVNRALSDFSASQFRRHRVEFKVEWQLAEKNGEVIFQKNYTGKSNHWKSNSLARSVFSQALEYAFAQLFADSDFLKMLAAGAPTSDSHHKIDPETDEPGLLSGLVGKARPYIAYFQRAKLAQVFSVVQNIKMASTQYYMSAGEWPPDLQTLGLVESDFIRSVPEITGVSVVPDGSIDISLSFGDEQGKALVFTPEIIPSMTMAIWHCRSNLADQLLPEALECRQFNE